MTNEEFYGSAYRDMQKAEVRLRELISEYSSIKHEKEGVKPIVYCCSRIKSPESMLRKLEERGFERSREAALEKAYDAIGIRAVCAFAEDVYRLVRWLKNKSRFLLLKRKTTMLIPNQTVIEVIIYF